MAWINVDYAFYTDVFKGEVIPDGAFDRCSTDAEFFINQITFGRVHQYELRPVDLIAVKMAVCAVAEVYYLADQHKDIKSENNDGYSVTYVDTSENALKVRAIEAADRYLTDTTLRNRMVSYDY